MTDEIASPLGGGFDLATKAGRLRKACFDLLQEHAANGDIPTNGRFLFYELEQRGAIPKRYDPGKGEPARRTPAQDISDALTFLRERGHIPWDWLIDETRSLTDPSYGATLAEHLRSFVDATRLDAWDGAPPPLIVCESRAVGGVIRTIAYEYVAPLSATGGQCGGFLVTDVAPLLRGNNRPVLYIGDYELRGPAEQIEANTRRVLERHSGRDFVVGEDWIKIALTAEQVAANPHLSELTIEKVDQRYKPPKRYQAVECEALGQSVLVRLIRDTLDAIRRQRGLPTIAEMQAREEEERQRLMQALNRLTRRRP